MWTEGQARGHKRMHTHLRTSESVVRAHAHSPVCFKVAFGRALANLCALVQVEEHEDNITRLGRQCCSYGNLRNVFPLKFQ